MPDFFNREGGFIDTGQYLISKVAVLSFRPGIVIVDAGYGNNTSFLLKLENRQLKYLGGLAKNRKVILNVQDNIQQTIRLDELAESLPKEAFTEIKLNLDKPKTVWVVTREIEISQLKGKRNIAIVMNIFAENSIFNLLAS